MRDYSSLSLSPIRGYELRLQQFQHGFPLGTVFRNRLRISKLIFSGSQKPSHSQYATERAADAGSVYVELDATFCATARECT